jgi:hypothetical protein
MFGCNDDVPFCTDFALSVIIIPQGLPLSTFSSKAPGAGFTFCKKPHWLQTILQTTNPGRSSRREFVQAEGVAH